MKRFIIIVTLLDGSTIEVLSAQSDRKMTKTWFNGVPEVEVDGVFYLRNAFFSYQIITVDSEGKPIG